MTIRLDKIDKLLRLYENNSEHAEANTALRKAGQLMREYIDESESPSKVEDKQAVDKICQGCASERPNHKDGCLTHKTEKSVAKSVMVGCGSCAGIMLLSFISLLVYLIGCLI